MPYKVLVSSVTECHPAGLHLLLWTVGLQLRWLSCHFAVNAWGHSAQQHKHAALPVSRMQADGLPSQMSLRFTMSTCTTLTISVVRCA